MITEQKVKGEYPSALIDSVLKAKGELWLVAAMVDGSIGYHTPSRAMHVIERYKQGHADEWCERCAACYGGDLIAMLESDINSFIFREQNYESMAKGLIAYCKRALAEDDLMAELTVGLLYPTMVL